MFKYRNLESKGDRGYFVGKQEDLLSFHQASERNEMITGVRIKTVGSFYLGMTIRIAFLSIVNKKKAPRTECLLSWLEMPLHPDWKLFYKNLVFGHKRKKTLRFQLYRTPDKYHTKSMSNIQYSLRPSWSYRDYHDHLLLL